MALLHRARPVNRKPDFNEGPSLDRESPINRGLAIRYLANEGGGATLHDLIGDTDILTGGAAFSADGVTYDGINDISKINSSLLDLSLIPQNGFSVSVGINCAPQNDRRFFGVGSTGSTILGLGLDNASPYSRLRVYQTVPYANNMWTGVGGPPIATGQDVNLVLVFVPGETAKVYINGVLEFTINRVLGGGTVATPYSAIGAAIRGTSVDGFSFYGGGVLHFSFYHRALSAEEGAALSANPYLGLADDVRRLPLGTTPSGGTTYTYTGDGGLLTGGVAPHGFTANYTGDGGLLTGGVAPHRFTANYTGDGGLLTSGVAPHRFAANYAGDGGLLTGGVAPHSFTANHTCDGGLLTGGVAPHRFTANYAGDGGLLAGGAADVAFTGAGTTYTYIGTGGLLTGGVAPHSFTANYAADGGIISGGTAALSVAVAPSSSGGLLPGGAAIVSGPTDTVLGFMQAALSLTPAMSGAIRVYPVMSGSAKILE